MYDLLVIGWGKGGKTLASILGNKGKKIAVIEKDTKMYGGTCPNVGCLPTKAMIHRSKIVSEMELLGLERDHEFNQIIYKNALSEKRKMVNKVNNANFNLLNNNENVDIYIGDAKFISNYEVMVNNDVIKAKNIIINTGSKNIIPNIKGIELDKVNTSEEILELETLPKKLAIIGAGYIGLEFASYFSNYGSQVSVFELGINFLPNEDDDVSEEIYKILDNQGININLNSKIIEFSEKENMIEVKYLKNSKEYTERFDRVLISIGRKPNIDNLGLENTNIKLNEKNAIKVNKYLETTVENIYALGDVKGGDMFTAVSLDDSRIILPILLGNDPIRSLEDIRNIPKVLFIDTPYSKVGLSEKEAEKLNIKYTVKKLATTSIPKSHVISQTDGFSKVLINENDEIIGAFIINYSSFEMINTLALAINQKIKYQVLKDLIYSHPVFTEGLNDLLK